MARIETFQWRMDNAFFRSQIQAERFYQHLNPWGNDWSGIIDKVPGDPKNFTKENLLRVWNAIAVECPDLKVEYIQITTQDKPDPTKQEEKFVRKRDHDDPDMKLDMHKWFEKPPEEKTEVKKVKRIPWSDLAIMMQPEIEEELQQIIEEIDTLPETPELS